ncbi:hypothetical protein [Streptomyces sp. NPDC048419]|uniref:hypothetical protein n=1 Tax=Streptomyces sp. NPDC048419 TaxID=3365547 RepID=UPI003722DC49
MITFDALHSVKAHVTWLVEAKQADYIAIIKTTPHPARWPPCPTSRSAPSKPQEAPTFAKTTRAIRDGPQRALLLLGITNNPALPET